MTPKIRITAIIIPKSTLIDILILKLSEKTGIRKCIATVKSMLMPDFRTDGI